LYVDDLLIFVEDMLVINKVKEVFSHEFNMKDLGAIEYYIGIQVIRDKTKRTINLGQSKYVGNIFNHFNMETCKLVKTPLDVNVKLTQRKQPAMVHEVEQMKAKPYKEAIGSLMFAMIVPSPNLVVLVGIMNKYM
jgi:hypothetical protein